LLLGRHKTYHPDTLLPILKPIWLAVLQSCGLRLRALLPQWLSAYEAGHRRLDADLRQRSRPVLLTRARPWRKNDNAHVEQRDWTRVREHFGYERYDNPEVTPLINALCAGALGQVINHGLRTLKLESKQRRGFRGVACELSCGRV
jgi:hypothetical protein